MSPLHIVVLAAGQGTRMRSALPKVLHPIGGLAMLERVVRTAHSLNAERVHVVYGHGGERVLETMAHLDVNWVEQRERLGTGHAVAQAMPAVPDSARVLVLYGDVPLIKRDTLQPMVDAAGQGELSVLSVLLEDPQGYGRIVRDDHGQVVAIVEHKDASAAQREIREVNTGILAAPAARLRAWLGALNNKNSQGEYYLTDVVDMAVQDRIRVRPIVASAAPEVSGVNDRVQLSWLERCFQREEAERLMRAGATLADPARIDVRGDVVVGSDVTIDVNVVFEGEVRIGDNVTIGPHSYIRDTVIESGAVIFSHCCLDGANVGARARIGPYARLRPGAALADEVHIGNFVEVKNSTIGHASKANHLTYLGDSQIGAGVNVGAGTITCNYDGANKHKTIIGDGAFIGSGVELVAPVTVHPGATIGAGSTISKDAPAQTLTLERAKQVSLPHWKRPVKAPKTAG